MTPPYVDDWVMDQLEFNLKAANVVVILDFKLFVRIAVNSVVIRVGLPDDEEVLFSARDPLMLFLKHANLEGGLPLRAVSGGMLFHEVDANRASIRNHRLPHSCRKARLVRSIGALLLRQDASAVQNQCAEDSATTLLPNPHVGPLTSFTEPSVHKSGAEKSNCLPPDGVS